MTQRMSDMLQLVVDVRNGLPAIELESPVSQRQAEGSSDHSAYSVPSAVGDGHDSSSLASGATNLVA